MSTSTSAGSAPLAQRAQLFHALSDETRLAVLEILRGGERCVCDLQDDLDAAQSRLSFHLKVLREAGLVRDRKEGRWSYYTLNPERLEVAAEFAREYLSPRSRADAAPGPKLHQLSRGRRGTAASGATDKTREGCCQ
ncbi:MAG: metalloregulator ArsR/SmtB family transcription factor [Gemmatimonadales bacterium]|nr:metalloregulator ArsR/SmtB family transcription factor [Gemmatimonadales bacterium]